MLVIDAENTTGRICDARPLDRDKLRVIKEGLGPDDRIVASGLMQARRAQRCGRKQGAELTETGAAGARARRSSGGRMRISHFFIDRPIFASVISIMFVILGGGASACRSRNIRRSPRRPSPSLASIPAPAPKSWPRPS